MKQLLGSKAEEAEKRVTSEDPGNTRRRVDTIGWEIRMGTVEEEPSIGVSNRNLRKALFRFLSIDEANEVTLEELQRLAGSAHRYTMICPFLRVFMGDLYCEYAGLDNKRTKRRLREGAITCIWLWRVFLVEAELAGGGFRLPLEYFRERTIVWKLEFDGSLKGVGLRVLRKIEDDWEEEWVAGIRLPFELKGDSSFRNTVEFIAVIAAYAIMARRGHRDLAIHLTGDSTTALAWAKNQNFKIGPSRNSAVVFVAIHVGTGFRSEVTTFVDSESNKFMDDLSRLIDPAGAPYFIPKSRIERIDCENEEDLVGRLICLCDPLRRVEGEEGVIRHWGDAKELTRRLLGEEEGRGV